MITPCFRVKYFFCAKRTYAKKAVWAAMPVDEAVQENWGPSSKFKCLAPATVFVAAENLIDCDNMSLRQLGAEALLRTGKWSRDKRQRLLAAKTQPRNI